MATWMRHNTQPAPDDMTTRPSDTQQPLLPTQLDHDSDSDSDFDNTAEHSTDTTSPHGTNSTKCKADPGGRMDPQSNHTTQSRLRQNSHHQETSTVQAMEHLRHRGSGSYSNYTHSSSKTSGAPTNSPAQSHSFKSTRRIASASWNAFALTKPFNKTTPPWPPLHCGNTHRSHMSHRSQQVAHTRPEEPSKATWPAPSRRPPLSPSKHVTLEHSYTRHKPKDHFHGHNLSTHPPPHQTN